MLTISGALPELLTLTVCAALVAPVRWLPKDRLVGLTATVGAVTVPESDTVEGLPAASCAIESVALLAPTLVGLNFTEIVQVALAATVVQPFTSSTKFDASLTVTPLTVRVASPLLRTVTDCAVLASPTR